jgi:hypothetical protein
LFALVGVGLCDWDIVGLKNAIGKTVVNGVGVDDVCWFIVNKEYLKNKNNVFGVFYDTNMGLIHIECEQSTGQAGEALESYLQRYGQPDEILHDNAKEFLHGNFAAICKTKEIRQKTSAPYTPNQNPAKNIWRYSHLALDLYSIHLAYPTNFSGNMLFFIAHTCRIEWLYPVDAHPLN